MKRRSLTVLLCLLAIISLASVGFASWVISAGDEEIATGNIQVEEVEDQRLDIIDLKFDKVVYENSETVLPEFVFGTPKNAVQDGWLTNKEIGEEKLKIVITFSVVYKNTTAKLDDSKVVASVDFSTVTENIFKVANHELNKDDDPNNDVYYVTIVSSKPTVTCSEGVYTCELELKWGNYFNNENPYSYYNSKPVAQFGDEAKERLTAMYSALKEAKYSVKITVNAKAE